MDIHWRPWFAWRPVRYESGGWAWLRWIERKWHGWDYSDANPFIAGHHYRPPCQHRAIETITRIGRDPSPFVHVSTRCKNCGALVPSRSPWSDVETHGLLKRAERLPEGMEEVVE